MAETPPTRPSLIARQDSSNSQLSSSAQARPKAHLVGKKNRSSGQLSKLTKTHSAKNLAKLNPKPHSKFKRTTSQARLQLEDPGDGDDGWVEDESSTATSGAQAIGDVVDAKRSVTEPNIPMNEQQNTTETEDDMNEPKELEAEIEDLPLPNQQITFATNPLHPTSKAPDPGRVSQRLLNRNVSFAAEPQITPIPASNATGDGSGATQTMGAKEGPKDVPGRTHAKFDGLHDSEDSQSPEEEEIRPTEPDTNENQASSSLEESQLFKEAGSSLERDPLPAASEDIDFAAEAAERLDHIVPSTLRLRTQYRLNVERLHAMNSREPRQRPPDTPGLTSIYGDRRAREIDPLTGRVSIPRVCREVRRDLKAIRARGRDPLGEVIDQVLKTLPPRDARLPKEQETVKVPQKKSSVWAGKRTAPPQKQVAQKDTNEVVLFTLEDRRRVATEFSEVCQRIWLNPANA